MKNLLLVIDIQKNFINEYTEDVISKIADLIEYKKFDFVAFTKYKNSENGLFARELGYLGCIKEEDQKLMMNSGDFPIFEKNVYTAYNPEFKNYPMENHIEQIYLCGIDTDACVFKTALDLFENEYDVYVLEKYCRSHIGKLAHEHAIASMQRLIGKKRVIL